MRPTLARPAADGATLARALELARERERRHPRDAPPHQIRGRGGERRLEGVQFRDRRAAGFQQRVAGGDCPDERLQRSEVIAVHRREGEVKPAPPQRGGAAQQL